MQLASRLHLPLQMCQAYTTESEFHRWIRFLRYEQKQPDWTDYYMARIACEIHNLRSCWLKKFHPVQLSAFLIRKPPTQENPDPSESKDHHIKKVHSFWNGFFGAYSAALKRKRKEK